MTQAITAKYRGPTNARGARIRISTEAFGSRLLPYEHGAACPYAHAARLYLEALDLEWDGLWIAGGLPDGSTVFVRAPHDTSIARTLHKSEGFRFSAE